MLSECKLLTCTGSTGEQEEGVKDVYAQMTTIEASPAKLDDTIRHVREQILPELQQSDGFKGFIALSDHRSGKLLGVTLWESEEVVESTEEVTSHVRGGIANPLGGAIVGAEDYEVSIFEVSS